MTARAWLLPGLIAALAALGMLALASASSSVSMALGHGPFGIFGKQLFYFALGLTVCVPLFFVGIERLARISPLLMLCCFGLLVLTLAVGPEINGATRWIRFGGASLQVSEFAKIAIILFLSAFAARRLGRGALSWASASVPLAAVSLLQMPIMLQPDFGTSVLIFLLSVSILFAAGMRLLQLVSISCGGAIMATLLIVSSEYRMERWRVFIDPLADPHGAGWQTIQSMIAFVRGGWGGQRIGEGLQKEFFLPEVQNDFIMAVVAEETGLVGFGVVLLLCLMLVLTGLSLGLRALRGEAPVQAYVALGVSLWIGVQGLMHVGAVTSILPPKGIPFPLFSAGGSSLIAVMIGLTLLLRVQHELERGESAARAGGLP